MQTFYVASNQQEANIVLAVDCPQGRHLERHYTAKLPSRNEPGSDHGHPPLHPNRFKTVVRHVLRCDMLVKIACVLNALACQ